jgi:hypothetical protein
VSTRRPAAPSAEQVQIGARIEQRIGGGFNSIHARDGIEDDAALLRVAVSYQRVQGNVPELDLAAAFRPTSGGVVNRVSGLGQLHQDVELDGALRDAFPNLIE